MTNLLTSAQALATADAKLRHVQRSLEALGWTILCADIDLTRETGRVELRRENRLVTLDARNGKASLTRELIGIDTRRVGRRGDIQIVERIQMHLLGRDYCGTGLQSGMRALANYIADNSDVSRLESRNAIRGLLG